MARSGQVIRARRRRDTYRLRERAERRVINKIEPTVKLSFAALPEANADTQNTGLRYGLSDKLTEALEDRKRRRDADIRGQLARLNEVVGDLLTLLESVASELHGEEWEVVHQSRVGQRTRPSVTVFKGRLSRRNKRGHPFAYRSEIEERMTSEMRELVAEYWFTFNGNPAIDTDLVRRIATRRTWTLIEQLS
jgi:hypothetical protein